MKRFIILFSLALITATQLTGCASFFGKTSQKNDWYGFMGPDDFNKHQANQILINNQRLAQDERRIALGEREKALFDSTGSTNKTALNQYDGYLKNEMNSSRTAQIIEIARITDTEYKEIEVVKAVGFNKKTFTTIDLPEGYYLVKWYNGDYLVQTDRIKAMPHRTVKIMDESDALETGKPLHFFSYCKR